MGKCPLFLSLLLLVILTACDANQSDSSVPRLVQEVTLPPVTASPTRILSPTPEPQTTSEIVSPLDVFTLEAEYILVTPTLPPSKTPTRTPTISPTPTQTPTPSVTVTATATSPLFPTAIIQPVTAIVINPLPQVCDSQWFFIEPRPASCPLSPPTASQGVYQQFQNGFMIWVAPQDAIYVLYNDLTQPRWHVLKDYFEEGMVEDDPAYAVSPIPSTWQPRRGFGMLWRANTAVRGRIGWAVEQWEKPFSVIVQTAADGTIFLSDPVGGVFSLVPGNTNWQYFSGIAGF